MSVDRARISRALYLDAGPEAASYRQAVNARLGAVELVEEIRRHLSLAPGQSLLDVGCGTGEQLAALATSVGSGGRAVGADFSPEAIEAARTRVGEAIVADAARIPLADASFDAICCNYAIYYLADPLAALREWRRLLVEGGRLVVTGPARGNNAQLYEFHEAVTGSPPGDADLMANGYVAESVLPLLGRAGFAGAECAELRNPLEFPSPAEFLAYWRATSLFARTIPPDRRAIALEAGEKRLAASGGFVVEKRITLVRALAS